MEQNKKMQKLVAEGSVPTYELRFIRWTHLPLELPDQLIACPLKVHFIVRRVTDID